MSTIINATTTNGVVIQPDNSGSLQLATNSGTTAVTIDTSQNVGIGTASPNYKLTFGGQTGGTATPLAIRFSNDYSNGSTAASSKIFLYNDGTTGNIWGIGVGSAADMQYHSGSTGASSGNHRWYTNDIERMRIDTSGNLLFNSGYGSVATAYGCRAWVNFNGTGTPAIRASGNVSSITDNGVGLYTINFTTAMPDVNYTIVGSSGTSAAAAYTAFVINVDGVGVRVAPTTSAFRMSTSNITSTLYDSYDVNISVFR